MSTRLSSPGEVLLRDAADFLIGADDEDIREVFMEVAIYGETEFKRLETILALVREGLDNINENGGMWP